MTLDKGYGDRTGQWFWEMLSTLGLNFMTDQRFDLYFTDSIMSACLNREIDYNGRGGLFIVAHPRTNMRDVDIWTQAMWHLSEVYKNE